MRSPGWLLLLLFGLAPTADAAQDTDCSNAPPAEAKALALKAARQVEDMGHVQAFKNFMDPEGEFFPRDLYVVVFDLDGNMWVNGGYPQFIGTNSVGIEDAKGRRYVDQMLITAVENGEGWIDHMWFNPCTAEYMDKSTFFKRVGKYVIGVGAYIYGDTLPVRPDGASRDLG